MCSANIKYNINMVQIQNMHNATNIKRLTVNRKDHLDMLRIDTVCVLIGI